MSPTETAAATVIAYSAALSVLIGAIVFFLLPKQTVSRASRFWYFLPFAFATLAALFLFLQDLFFSLWTGRMGAFFIVMAYGAAWQTARVINNRRPVLHIAFFLCLAWLLYSAILVPRLPAPGRAASYIILCLLHSLFDGLSAREFYLARMKQPSSAAMLFWVFAVYCGMDLLRIPFTAFLPAPLGMNPTKLWSVVVYNILVMVQALLVSSFMIALSRDRVAAENYRLALRDPLTGVGNRRALEASLGSHVGLWGSSKLAVITFDIDYFKSINDRYGHAYGDKVIVLAAQVANRVLRNADSVFRIGGEEFVCFIDAVTDGQALRVAERLRETFEYEARQVDGKLAMATISVGVAYGTRSDWTQILKDADAALYQAKQAGRNRVIAATSETTAPLPV